MELLARIMIDFGCGTFLGALLLLVYLQIFGGSVSYEIEGLIPKIKRLKRESKEK